MRVTVKNRKDLYSGLIFVVFGALFAFIARDYPMGSALRMGPAYFPTILGSLLVILGAIIAARSMFLEGEPIAPIGYRELGLILGSLILFGLMLDQIGMIISTTVLIFVGAMAGHEYRTKEVIVLAAVLLAVAVGVFYYGLALPFTLWPRFLS
jgi:putative tricarboxylic transport membrane protein